MLSVFFLRDGFEPPVFVEAPQVKRLLVASCCQVRGCWALGGCGEATNSVTVSHRRTPFLPCHQPAKHPVIVSCSPLIPPTVIRPLTPSPLIAPPLASKTGEFVIPARKIPFCRSFVLPSISAQHCHTSEFLTLTLHTISSSVHATTGLLLSFLLPSHHLSPSNWDSLC